MILLVAGMHDVEVAKANFMPLPTLPPPIYIRSDGSIDPSTAPIQQIGDTYIFTSNINSSIEVQRGSIVLDGNGFTIIPTGVNTEGLMKPLGWYPAIHVVGQNNVTITGIAFQYCNTAVAIQDSSGITISKNTIQASGNGIVVFSSSNVNITSNGFVGGAPIFCGQTKPGSSYPDHLRIEGNFIEGGDKGIWAGFGDSNIIGNDFSGNKVALYLSGSNNLITSNNFEYGNNGIFFTGDQTNDVNNSIYGNNFNHNSENAVVPFIKKPPPNFWDNGTYGNYWSDYTGTDTNGDGKGDSPYVIETVYYDYGLGKNVTVQEGKDNYPVMAPFLLSLLRPTLPTLLPPPPVLISLPSPTSTSLSTLTPTSNPALIVSLSESASALDYGVKVNFTATADGGLAPYTFNWYVDNQSSANGSSPYFSLETMPVGSHHVYVQVNDANGNSAITNTVEFNILPSPSNLSPSPTIPEFPSFTFIPIIISAIVVGTIITRKKLRHHNYQEHCCA